MTTDLKLPVDVYKHFFGDIPEQNEIDTSEHTEKFNGATLIFPEKMRESRRKNLLEMLQEVYDHLNSVGLSKLFDCDIRFVDVGLKYVGLYFPGTKDIRIKPNANNSKQVVFTVIHEFGHKLYFEYLTPKELTEIKEKFKELVNSGQRIIAEIGFSKKAVLNLEPGNILIYGGKNKKYKQISRFEVVSIIGDKVKIKPENENYFSLSGPLFAFVPPEWNLESEKIPSTDSSDTKLKYDTISDSWFPTAYSMKNVEEWWAENFAFFVLNHIKNQEVHDFFAKYIIK